VHLLQHLVDVPAARPVPQPNGSHGPEPQKARMAKSRLSPPS
jgi:hypothetical protein